MKNKVLVELVIPELEEAYNVYIPINKKIGNVIVLINKAIFDLSKGLYQVKNDCYLYNRDTSERYETNLLIKDTGIRNGSTLILI